MRRWLAYVYLTCIAVLGSVVTAQQDSASDIAAITQILKGILPDCSVNCLATVVPENDCPLLDTNCICSNANISSSVAACLAETCTAKESLTTLKYSADTCGYPVRDKSNAARAVTWTLFCFSVLSIALRFVARSPYLQGPGYGWDDWAMIVVLGFLIGQEITVEKLLQNGLGRDMWALVPDWQIITNFLYYFWVGIITYNLVVMTTKIAILLLYVRIFPSTVSTWFRLACWVLIGICTAVTIANVFWVTFECSPIPGAYMYWTGEEHFQCVNKNVQVIAMACVNIILDLSIFLLPIPKIIHLNISAHKKAGVCLTFLVGLFVTIVSIIRLWELVVVVTSGYSNITYDSLTIALWTQAEENVGVICACMPSYARLIRKFWGHLVTKITTRGSSGVEGSGQSGSTGFRKPYEAYDIERSTPPSKTIETSVVFGRRRESSDEVQLVDRPEHALPTIRNDAYEHDYANEW